MKAKDGWVRFTSPFVWSFFSTHKCFFLFPLWDLPSGKELVCSLVLYLTEAGRRNNSYFNHFNKYLQSGADPWNNLLHISLTFSPYLSSRRAFHLDLPDVQSDSQTENSQPASPSTYSSSPPWATHIYGSALSSAGTYRTCLLCETGARGGGGGGGGGPDSLARLARRFRLPSNALTGSNDLIKAPGVMPTLRFPT